MKYIIILLFVVIMISIFAQNRTISISGIPNNAPYAYTDSNGELDGYIPKVAEVIMKDAALSYEINTEVMLPMYHYNGTSEKDNLIQLDDLHMTGVISNKKRSTFYYSIPYLTIEFYVLSRKGDFYCGVNDFADKKVGVTKDNNSEARLLVYKDDEGSLLCDTIVTFPKLSVGLKKLVDGEIDYVMVSEFCLISQKSLLDEFDVEINYGSLSPLEISIASKDKVLIAKINKSITQLKEAGTFDKLLAKYVVCDAKAAKEKNLYCNVNSLCCSIIASCYYLYV